jgi:cytochrome c-type biogenesis protein CcmH
MTAARTLAVALLLCAAGAGAAVFEAREFPSADAERRYKVLINELRCLVCQNQNLADSNADLASDLRREVHRMILDGQSDAEIVEFMVARYGDFVLYRPPWKAKTVMLWIGPFLLGAGGLILLYRYLRRRRALAPAATPLSDSERERVRRLLEDEQGESS